MPFEKQPEYKILKPKVNFVDLPGFKPPPLATAVSSDLMQTLENWAGKDTSSSEAQHHQTLINSVRTTPAKDIGVELAASKEALWDTCIDTGTATPLRAGPTPFKENGNKNPSGAYARNLFRSAYNLPSSFTVPAIHSGFTLSIQSPTNGEHLKLHEQLLEDKRRLGRNTYGISLSTHLMVANAALIRLIADNIRYSTLALPDGADILEYISIRDINPLVLAFANTIWPNGFKFSRPCNSEATVCSDIQEEIIDLSELFRFDKRGLSSKETAQLGRTAKASVTTEEANEYRRTMKANADKVYKIDERLSLVLCTPTVAEYLRYGQDWINRIAEGLPENMVEKSTDNREAWFGILAANAELSSYGHIVKEIRLIVEDSDEPYETVVSTPTDIANILADLSTNAEVSKEIIKAINTHIGGVGAALIGVPSYTCPTCKKEHNVIVDGTPIDFIPIDPIGLFFQMLRRAVLELNSKRVSLATYTHLEKGV